METELRRNRRWLRQRRSSRGWEKIDLPPHTKDEFYADLMRVTCGRSVPELAELLVNESYPTVKCRH
jgi:hypothetical protein